MWKIKLPSFHSQLHTKCDTRPVAVPGEKTYPEKADRSSRMLMHPFMCQTYISPSWLRSPEDIMWIDPSDGEFILAGRDVPGSFLKRNCYAPFQEAITGQLFWTIFVRSPTFPF